MELTMPSPKDELERNNPTAEKTPMSADCRLLSDSLLHLFIEYAWKHNYGRFTKVVTNKFRYWVSSERIDFNNDNWLSLIRPMNNLNCYYSRDWWIHTIPAIFYAIADRLKYFLPILFNCEGNINFTDKDGRTILHIFLASIENENRSSKCEIVKDTILVGKLIEKGASVNIVDKLGYTPFAMAAMYGQKENVDLMIKNFTNTDACDKDGNTALHIVVDKSLTIEGEHVQEYTDIVDFLLKKGADFKKKNKRGLTPVQLAASKYNVAILVIFKIHLASYKILTEDGENLIFLVCKNKWCVRDETRVSKTIDYLVNECCIVNKVDNNNCSPLHYASQWDRGVECLIKYGVRMNCRTKIHRQTPLHWAMKGYHFNLKTIQTLVQNRANVNAKAADGATPLLMAVMRSSPEIVDFLIKQGANVNDKDDIFGFTPLHLAVFDKEKMAQLIHESNDVNVASKHGITPLHLASLAGNNELMDTLIMQGANVDIRDNLKRTCWHMVLLGNFFLNLDKFIDKFIDEESKKISFVNEMWSSLWCRYDSLHRKDAIASISRTTNPNVNAADVNGIRPLHLAARDPLGNLIETLLTLGAQIDVFDHNGRLPVHEVIDNDNIEGLKCLLNFGMDVNEKCINRLIMDSKKEIRDVVFSHLVKLQAAGLPIADIYKPHVNKNEYQTELHHNSYEVTRMKNHMMGDGTSSLYDFLRMNWRRRITLIPFNYTRAFNQYEIYQKIILSKCREALDREVLLTQAMNAWYKITQYHIPDICVEYIFEFLSNGHLTALIESADHNYDDEST